MLINYVAVHFNLALCWMIQIVLHFTEL